MRHVILVALATALTLVGCTTTPVAKVGQEIRFTTLDEWADDMEVYSIQGVRNDDKVAFTVKYRSGIARQFSFFI